MRCGRTRECGAYAAAVAVVLCLPPGAPAGDAESLAGREFGRGEAAMLRPAVLGGEEPALLAVDAALRMTVLDKGGIDGMRAGMQFAVLRGERAVAAVRVVDVRKRISGAVVVETGFKSLPLKGDRLVGTAGTGN